jgi:hypothetical protein
VLFHSNSWAAFDSAPYFPIHTGDSWTYLEDGSVSNTTTVLPGTTLINGTATKAVVESADGFAAYYTNDANGIRLHRQVDPVHGITVTFVPPVVLATAVSDIGQTANTSGTAQTNLGDATYSASFTIEAVENTTVPLRTFNNVVRVGGTVTIVGGGTVSFTGFFARNVGPVKLIDSDGTETVTSELTATNVTPNEDFDADVKSDISVYQTGTGNWFFVRSTSGFGQHLSFGGANFLPVPGDYDGDGETDTAVYDITNGNWFIAQSTAGFKIHPSFGGAGFIPVPGDYDADGKMDVAVHQTSTGHWFFVGATSGFGFHLAFGGAGYMPVPGDYDGDGQTDTAVYNTIDGNWFIAQSTAGFLIHPSFGGTGFVPVPPQVTILRALGLL